METGSEENKSNGLSKYRFNHSGSKCKILR